MGYNRFNELDIVFVGFNDQQRQTNNVINFDEVEFIFDEEVSASASTVLV